MTTKRRSSPVSRTIARYVGWITLGTTLILWGRLDPTVTTVLVLTAALYIGFRTPTWCGAETRNRQLCRKNAYGVLMGCSYRQHRWQKLKLAVIPMAWRKLWDVLWRADKVQTVGLVVALFTAVFGGLQALGTLHGPF